MSICAKASCTKDLNTDVLGGFEAENAVRERVQDVSKPFHPSISRTYDESEETVLQAFRIIIPRCPLVSAIEGSCTRTLYTLTMALKQQDRLSRSSAAFHKKHSYIQDGTVDRLSRQGRMECEHSEV